MCVFLRKCFNPLNFSLGSPFLWTLLHSLVLMDFGKCKSYSKPSTKSAFSYSSHKESSLKEDTFIINLLHQDRFADCSLFILQDRHDNGESVDKILSESSIFSGPSTMKSAYSLKYTYPDSSEVDNIDKILSELNLKLLRGVDNITTSSLMPKNSYPGRFPMTVKNNRRKGDQCMIVIAMINDFHMEFMRQVFNMITPVYIPIIRKDEDFFIFKTDSALHERMLFMRELPGRTKFKIAVGSRSDGESGTQVVIRTVCFFCDGGNPRLVELPVDADSLPERNTDYFQDFVWNLNGKVLHVSLPYIRAKIEADEPWHGTSNARRGNWKMLFENFLTVKFNFTYHMFVSTGKDGRFGGGGTGLQLPNGSWIGVTGDLISGQADLGIVIANTPKRIHYIDFTDSFYDIGCLTYVTAQPTAIYSPAALLWPFDLGMWACIASSTVLSILFFFVAFKLMSLLRIGCGENWSLGVQIQFLLSTFLEQDSPVVPESHALRCFVALWLFFTMVLTTVYRSKMVTLLAFPVLGKLPTTFDELAFSDYEVGFMKHGDSAYNTLAASTDPVYVKLVGEMELFTGVGLECLEKVVTHQYGCIAYDFALVHLRERNLSDSDTRKLVFAPARTYNIWLGLGTEGKSIYRLNFGKMLSYTRQFHLADIWDKIDMYANVRQLKLNWWQQTNQTDKAMHHEGESDNLTLKHIAGAFYVLIACLLLSVGTFGHELLSHNKKLLYNEFLFHFWALKNASTKWRKKTRQKSSSSFVTGSESSLKSVLGHLEYGLNGSTRN